MNWTCIIIFVFLVGIVDTRGQQTDRVMPLDKQQDDIYTFSNQWRSTLDGFSDVVADTLVLIPRGLSGSHVTNQDTLLGAGTYRFNFRTGCDFEFAWRISSHSEDQGTALVFRVESMGNLSLSHITWTGLPHKWFNATQKAIKSIPFSLSTEEWHEVEINDVAKAVSISLDGQVLPLFVDEVFPVEMFFSNTEHGYVGVGMGSPCAVSFYGLTFQPNDAIDPPKGRMALNVALNLRDLNWVKYGLTVIPGDTVVVDIVAVSGARNISQFQVELGYDSRQIEFLKFEVQDLMQTGNVVVEHSSEDTVRVGAILPGTLVPSNSGHLGEIHFRVLSEFYSSTINLLNPQFDRLLQDWSIGSQISLHRAQSTDFNGDGFIGFPDFILFAIRFGESEGGPSFNALFDLNKDGTVNFPDFIIFIASFGRSDE